MHESICLVVDVASALAQGTAEGNTFMVNAMVQDKGSSSHHDGSPVFIRVTGVHDRFGRPISEVTLNWSVTGLQIESGRGALAGHADTRRGSQLSLLLGLARVAGSSQTVSQVLNRLAEEPNSPHATTTGAEQPGRFPPVLVSISGPAVDDEVIFPALYGSPDFGTYGWYWSASVDTNKVGIHAFTMHFALFRPDAQVPEILTCNANLEVCHVRAVNGFTGAEAGWLPLPAQAIDFGYPAPPPGLDSAAARTPSTYSPPSDLPQRQAATPGGPPSYPAPCPADNSVSPNRREVL